MANSVGEHLLDVGVGEHLQPIGVVKALLDVEVAALAVLHIHRRTMVAAGAYHALQFDLIEVVYHGLTDFVDFLAGFGVVQ